MNRKLLAIFFFFTSLTLVASTPLNHVNEEVNPVLSIVGPEFSLNPNPVNGSYFYVNLNFSEVDLTGIGDWAFNLNETLISARIKNIKRCNFLISKINSLAQQKTLSWHL